MQQPDRERALCRLRNGSAYICVATDLAARGLDITDVGNIIHYHIPPKADVYTHRNGRTARVEATGEAYVITGPEETIPDFIHIDDILQIHPDSGDKSNHTFIPDTASLYFNAGKKEKISRGDIVGFLLNNSTLTADEIGSISLYDHYAIAAIPAPKAQAVLNQIERLKIKNKRLKITLVE